MRDHRANSCNIRVNTNGKTLITFMLQQTRHERNQLAHILLGKISRHVNPNQQHRRTVGEGVVAVSNAAIGPAAAESNDAVIAITIHLQRIAGTRQVEHVQCG